MIRLAELFDNPLDYSQMGATTFRFRTDSDIPVIVTVIDIETSMGIEGVQNVHREIMRYLGYSSEDIAATKNFLSMMSADFGGELLFYIDDPDIHDDTKKFALTQKGEQFSIFSTIFAILKNEFTDLGYFVFTGDDDHRKFYDNLMTWLPRKLPQFKFVDNYIHINGEGYIYVNPKIYVSEVDQNY